MIFHSYVSLPEGNSTSQSHHSRPFQASQRRDVSLPWHVEAAANDLRRHGGQGASSVGGFEGLGLGVRVFGSSEKMNRVNGVFIWLFNMCFMPLRVHGCLTYIYVTYIYISHLTNIPFISIYPMGQRLFMSHFWSHHPSLNLRP